MDVIELAWGPTGKILAESNLWTKPQASSINLRKQETNNFPVRTEQGGRFRTPLRNSENIKAITTTLGE